MLRAQQLVLELVPLLPLPLPVPLSLINAHGHRLLARLGVRVEEYRQCGQHQRKCTQIQVDEDKGRGRRGVQFVDAVAVALAASRLAALSLTVLATLADAHATRLIRQQHVGHQLRAGICQLPGGGAAL